MKLLFITVTDEEGSEALLLGGKDLGSHHAPRPGTKAHWEVEDGDLLRAFLPDVAQRVSVLAKAKTALESAIEKARVLGEADLPTYLSPRKMKTMTDEEVGAFHKARAKRRPGIEAADNEVDLARRRHTTAMVNLRETFEAKFVEPHKVPL
jgi:hypothetical protein